VLPGLARGWPKNAPVELDPATEAALGSLLRRFRRDARPAREPRQPLATSKSSFGEVLKHTRRRLPHPF